MRSGVFGDASRTCFRAVANSSVAAEGRPDGDGSELSGDRHWFGVSLPPASPSGREACASSARARPPPSEPALSGVSGEAALSALEVGYCESRLHKWAWISVGETTHPTSQLLSRGKANVWRTHDAGIVEVSVSSGRGEGKLCSAQSDAITRQSRRKRSNSTRRLARFGRCGAHPALFLRH